MLRLVRRLLGLSFDPAILRPRPARIEQDLVGITWRVRPRAAPLQLLLSLGVGLSTGLLALAWGLGWLRGAGGGVLVRSALPGWALVQLCLMGLASGWDMGRARPARVRILPRDSARTLRIGSRELRLDQIGSIRVESSGWGPVYRAEVIVECPEAPIVIAADGDSAESLEALVARIEAIRLARPVARAIPSGS